MTDDDFFEDPAPPAEASGLRGDDLLNKVICIRPLDVGEYPPTPAQDGKEAMKGGPYVVCEVWVIGIAGIEDHDTSVRISWWRAVPGLKARIGSFIAGKVKVNDDRSRTIERLKDNELAAVRECKVAIQEQAAATDAGVVVATAEPANTGEGTEPF